MGPNSNSISGSSSGATNQDAYPVAQAPIPSTTDPVTPKTDSGVTPATPQGIFPTKEQQQRLQDYEYFNRLFMGDHYGAFNVRISDDRYTQEYSKLRYVMANFAALVSKICADMLFSEQPNFKTEDGDQEFIEALIHENNLNTQNYESALSNSYYGDAVYKIRVGKRFPNDPAPTVIIEDISPIIYFPKINGFNVRQEPAVKELIWTFTLGKDTYLRKEIHEPGRITNEVYKMQGDKILEQVELSILGDQAPEKVVETGIDRSLIVHVPNWKTGNRYFGISDYQDLDKLFYAINNRLTKVDNILDKHGDPILVVPPGVIDEHGNVRKKALGLLEVQEGEQGKPEYITWDASLDNAFKEIDNLVEFLYMTSETSPDVLGMGQGKSDSGRAIKLKIMRTIAKVARKKLYYDRGLKEVLYVAQLMAKAHNLDVGGLKLSGDATIVDIEWQDGLPIDNAEQVTIEVQRIEAGLTTVPDALMRLDGIDDDTAQQKAKEITDAKAIAMPSSSLGTKPFGPNDPRTKSAGSDSKAAGK